MVTLRHHTDDTGVFAEIFRAEYYVLPPALSLHLRALGTQARFVDLGANIGLFGVWLLSRFPQATVTAFEPDPINLRSLHDVRTRNRASESWSVIPACAANYAGSVPFASLGTSVSRMLGDARATTRVPTVDVFEYLHGVHVVKMDIEGGEWDILLDRRWAAVSAQAVLMEYHPYMCPSSDARSLAVEILENAGYEVECLVHHAAGHGMLRALRPEIT